MCPENSFLIDGECKCADENSLVVNGQCKCSDKNAQMVEGICECKDNYTPYKTDQPPFGLICRKCPKNSKFNKLDGKCQCDDFYELVEEEEGLIYCKRC